MKLRLLPCLVLLATAPLAAQSSADRVALARWEDSLQGVTDFAALPATDATSSSTTQLLTAGIRLLRGGQLAHDRGALFDALRTFDKARQREPSWPWPRFGLALAKLALHEDGAISRPDLGGQLAGESYFEGYHRSLKETFVRDSLFQPALRLLVPMVAHEREREQPKFVARAIERAAGLWPADSLAHLALGFVYQTDFRYSDARREFQRYAERGGDPAITMLEEARAAAGEGRLTEAAGLYLMGSYHTGDSARARYRQDLTWIATPRELGEFDAQTSDSLPVWLAAFWRKRDALELRAGGDRLEEHLRRWAYVYRMFRIEHAERWASFLKARSYAIAPCIRTLPDSLNEILLSRNASTIDDKGTPEAVLDHRAIIYMRHGAPAWGTPAAGLLADTAVTLALAGKEPDAFARPTGEQPSVDPMLQSLLWVYWIRGRSRAYFFEPTLLKVSGSSRGPLALAPTLPLSELIMWRLSDLDPVYKRTAKRIISFGNGLGHATPLACLPTVQEMMIRSEADVQTAVRTDSYSLLFSHELDAQMQVYAVGSSAQGTARLLITAALPAAALDSLAIHQGGKLEWPLHMRITAVDTLAGRIARSDTVRTFVASAPLAGGGFLGFITELPVAAGHYLTHAAVFDSALNSGTAAEWGNVVVQPATFSMSDVVLGVETGGVVWQNHGDPFRVNVTGGYHRTQPAPIYYELYGRIPGRSYRTSIAVHERDKPGKRGVMLEFTRPAERPDEHVRLTLDLSRLRKGQYQLTVSVTDEVTHAVITTNRIVEIAE